MTTRDELVTMVGRALGGGAYAECTQAGKELADQSKLPPKVAENLGAGFGQWDFFPEAAEIVDWALAYVPPETPEDVWTIARTWSADDAGKKHSILALVGLDLLKHELRRIPVPELQPLADENRAAKLLSLRAELGLAVPKGASAAARPAAPRAAAAPRNVAAGGAPIGPTEVRRMPRPEFKKPEKAAIAPPRKRFAHPKFGEGILEAQAGEGPEAKLTIKFGAGTKTLQAKYVTELPAPDHSS